MPTLQGRENRWNGSGLPNSGKSEKSQMVFSKTCKDSETRMVTGSGEKVCFDQATVIDFRYATSENKLLMFIRDVMISILNQLETMWMKWNYNWENERDPQPKNTANADGEPVFESIYHSTADHPGNTYINEDSPDNSSAPVPVCGCDDTGSGWKSHLLPVT